MDVIGHNHPGKQIVKSVLVGAVFKGLGNDVGDAWISQPERAGLGVIEGAVALDKCCSGSGFRGARGMHHPGARQRTE